VKVGAALLAVLIAFAASACCGFGPCDRVSILVGRVSTAEGAAVSGANIAAFGHDATTDSNGCFEVGGIEMGKYQLQISAQAFEPLTVPAKSGMYQVKVLLAPQGSSVKGNVQWTKSLKGRPTAVPRCT
jgi:hypothetical protein